MKFYSIEGIDIEGEVEKKREENGILVKFNV